MKGRKSGTKIIVICLSVLLVAGAFLLPSGLFELQDRARAQQSTSGVREKVSLENLSENYEKSLHNRMSILAERLGDGRNAVYVSESEVTLTEDEKAEFLTKLRDQEILYFYDKGFRYVDLYALEKLEDDRWKSYVIYDSQGILLVCYYIELWDGEIGELQLLVDAEDGKIYFEQGIDYGQHALAESGYEKKKKDSVAMVKVDAWLYGWIESVTNTEIAFWDVFFELLRYYEVDYMEDSGYKEQYHYDKEMNNHTIPFTGIEFAKYLGEKYPIKGLGSDDDWWMQMELIYGDGRLVWELDNGRKRVYGDGGRAKFFQGFPDLAGLIPEYKDHKIYEEPEGESGEEF